MASRTLPARLAIVAAALVASWGCGGGDGLPRQAISGKVTLDGQPLESALVTFTPAAAGGDSTSGAAQVASGSFSIPAAEGLIPGKYRAAVSVKKEVTKKAPRKKQVDNATGEEIEPAETQATEEALPARYNARSELTAEVSATGSNDFTFALESR